MSQHVVSKGTIDAGDVLLKGAKLDKAVVVRLGSGGTAPGTSATITSFVLPAQAVVYDAFLNVITPSTGATKTVSVGTSGTPTGFLTGIDVSTTGLKLPVVAGGTSGAGTYGSLFLTFTTGNAPVTKSYASDVSASRTISFTPNSSEWVAFAADLYLSYIDLTL
jgi:hypothetical protein